jgi:tetratricopeptide (TPR) repeat protein
VAAYREGLSARVARWSRRHRPLVATAVAILATATAGLAAGLFAVNAEKNRTELARLGESHQRTRAEAREKEARDKEAEAKAVLGFVENKILAAARPKGQEGGLGYDVTLRQALEASIPQIAHSFKGRPAVEGAVRLTMGTSLAYLGDDASAARQFEIARDLFKPALGSDHSQTLTSMNNLAVCLDNLGRHAEALTIREEILPIQKAKGGTDHVDTLRCMLNLGNSYFRMGRPADALKQFEETLALATAKLGADSAVAMSASSNLATCLEALGRNDEALKLREESLEQAKAKQGADHPDTLAKLNNLANSYNAVGNKDKALALRVEAVALRKASLGPEHPDTLMTMHNLANSYHDLGRYGDALKLREDAVGLARAKLGEDHPMSLALISGLASSYIALDRDSEALALIDDFLRRTEGRVFDLRLKKRAIELRLRVFAKLNDASGCRESAVMWEKVMRDDADSLYDASCYRAVTAAVSRLPDAAADADKAMEWLAKAIPAGYNTPQKLAHMMRDSDLDVLRTRDDFRRLMGGLMDRYFPADPFAK